MSLILEKYADVYGGLEILDAVSGANGAYLLVGEDADGLSILSRFVAAKLSGLDKSKALGDCADIAVFPRRDDEKPAKGKKAEKQKRVMAVDDVERIIDSMYFTPFELDKRVYIIENAETMSEICQNKLLKSLEEPPERVCFVLCATRAMLPTVESRCITIHLPPFDTQTVRSLLTRFHNNNSVDLAARACRGNLGLAERMLEDKDFADTYAQALKILRLATGSRMFSRVSAVYDKFTREKTDGVLGLMEYLLNDVSRLLSGLDTVFLEDDVRSVSVGFTAYSAAKCTEFVRSAKKSNEGNCMIAALMDELILKIMEEKALCQR